MEQYNSYGMSSPFCTYSASALLDLMVSFSQLNLNPPNCFLQPQIPFHLKCAFLSFSQTARTTLEPGATARLRKLLSNPPKCFNPVDEIRTKCIFNHLAVIHIWRGSDSKEERQLPRSSGVCSLLSWAAAEVRGSLSFHRHGRKWSPPVNSVLIQVLPLFCFWRNGSNFCHLGLLSWLQVVIEMQKGYFIWNKVI